MSEIGNSEEIAVCLIVNNLFFETKYCIENLLAKTSCKIRLYIYDNGSTDERLISYCKDLCEKTKSWFGQGEKTMSQAMNVMLPIIYQKYGVIFPVNCLVHNNWLEDLISSMEVMSGIGIASIRNGFENVSFMPMLHDCHSLTEDKLENIYISQNNSVDGLMFFSPSILKDAGLFCEDMIEKGYESLEWCFRVSANGYKNIYIRKQTLIKLPLENEVIFPKKTIAGMEELKEKIEVMVKVKQFKR